MSLDTEHYPLDTRDAQLQGETLSPKIPAISKRVPTITNEVTKRDVQGSVAHPQDISSGFDQKSELSEQNVHAQFVNTQSLGRDD
jgi:hypothetical protein